MASLAALFLVILIFITISRTHWLLAAALAVVFFSIGYLAMARRVLAREDSRPIPQLVRRPDDPGLGHTAVIYFTHGEPETYDPIGWINQFRELDDQKIPFVPFFTRPFFLHSLRNKYLAVGKSDHRATHHKMVANLEERFRRDGDSTTRFYLSFLDDNPRPVAATIRALQ